MILRLSKICVCCSSKDPSYKALIYHGQDFNQSISIKLYLLYLKKNSIPLEILISAIIACFKLQKMRMRISMKKMSIMKPLKTLLIICVN